MVAQAAFLEEKGKRALMREAQELSFTRARTPGEEELDRIRGPQVADSVSSDHRFARVAADPRTETEAQNPAGSFEAFTSMLGGGVIPPAVVPE
jgi:hypothetical protein